MSLFLIFCLLGMAIPLTAFSDRLPPRLHPWLIPLPAIGGFVLLLSQINPLLAGETIAYRFAWVPSLAIDFGLILDGWRFLLAALVMGIGSLILLYACGYMGNHPQKNRLVSFLYAFMLAMAGVALSDHLLLLFIFWELTSILSYLLIGFDHQNEKARKSALQALLITGLGGMALLAGLVLLRTLTGTWFLSEMIAQADLIRSADTYSLLLGLIVFGALSKSAQFPLQFWLSNAMTAPTPISAYLHSATMVKAGVFLLILLHPILGGSLLWFYILSTIGSITLLAGGIFGLQQTDLKKILAGTTVAVLGLLTLLLGLGSEKALLALYLFFLAHALYKAALFMVAGIIDHETGTRDIRLLGNLRRAMPWTAAAALLAALSKMGLPPFFGFLGKEYTYKASLYADGGWIFTCVLLLGNAMMFALAIKTSIIPFWRKHQEPLPKSPHEAPFSLVFPPLLLATTGLCIGLFPQLVTPLINSALQSASASVASVEVSLWHGFNLPLLLSGLTLLLGFGILFQADRIKKIWQSFGFPSTEILYSSALTGIVRGSRWMTATIQSGYLHRYLMIILGSTAFLIGLKLWRFGIPDFSISVEGVSIFSLTLIATMLGAIAVAISTQSRLVALIALGVIGFGVAIIFGTFSAPDLAITQILVETLTIVFFAWTIAKLPSFKKFSSRKTQALDMVVSIGIGGLITVLLISANAIDLGPSISKTLTEWSFPEAYGRNIVNVILVDFRALDTWGEVCVLGIAALGVWALQSQLTTKEEKK